MATVGRRACLLLLSKNAHSIAFLAAVIGNQESTVTTQFPTLPIEDEAFMSLAARALATGCVVSCLLLGCGGGG